MDKSYFLSIISHQYLRSFLLLTVLLLLGFACGIPEPEEYLTYVTRMDQAIPEEYKSYIIHMDHTQKPDSFSTHESWHRHTVRSLSAAADDDQKALLYSYNHVMHGFSARLTPSQLAQLESLPAHRATFKDSVGKLLTTHTPKFLGLNHRSGVWPDSLYGKDVIIGVIDSGIWPESESFNDKGMQPVPKRWKGVCENGTAFSPSLCNNKIIGARSYIRGFLADGEIIDEFEYNSTRDYNGHGSHVASTAAGIHALGVSHFGYASGTASGVAPAAHIAIYKAMWSMPKGNGGSEIDILAAIDQAIADGVDILNLSLYTQIEYFQSVVAVGALSAIERGIVVIGAAGNDGPKSGTVANGAPWITTVGSGTVDRIFTAELKLGNGLTVEGRSYFPQSVYITNASLYYDNSNFAKRICNSSALDPDEVSGKVVLCDSSNGTNLWAQILEVQRVRAIAGIFISDEIILPYEYVIPSVALPTAYGPKVRQYAATQNPRPTVKSMRFVLTRLGDQTQAPKVASHSSRGPDVSRHGILKPDILAPGYEILAAYPPMRTIMNVGNYSLVTDYMLGTGTSMAAPHIAGVAALVKAVHPDWSPAAIKSALMTTANTVDNKNSQIQDQSTGLLATPLDFGAGHVNPNKAIDPGLVYDMGIEDYVEFICGIGYTKKQISALLRRNEWNCRQNQTDLNYPSFNADFFVERVQRMKFKRTVTNVGNDMSTYKAVLVIPNGMRIRVQPRTMTFTKRYQKQSFTLSVEIDKDSPSINYGFLKWIDQHNHVVASPVVGLTS